MANKFKCNTLLLTSQVVQASGDTIIVNTTPLVKSTDTGNFITNSQTGGFVGTGQTGQFYSSNNPNNYISYAAVGGVRTVNITGSLLSGALTLTGIGGLIITQNSNTISFSGGGGQGSTETASNIGAGSGILSGTVSSDFKLKTLIGGSGIQINGSASNDTLTLSVTGYDILTKGATFYNADGIVSGQYSIPVWYAPFNCNLTNIRAYLIGNSGATVNAYKNKTGLHLASNMIITGTGLWFSSGASSGSYTVGDTFEVKIYSVTGNPISLTIQGDFIKL